MPLEHVLHLLHRPPYITSMHSCISFLRMHDSIMDSASHRSRLPSQGKVLLQCISILLAQWQLVATSLKETEFLLDSGTWCP